MNFRKMYLLALSALVVVSLGPITHHSAVSPSQVNMLLTDGVHPMPPPSPWPPASGSRSPSLTADGVHPMPPPSPWPPASGSRSPSLTADGVHPMPPPSPWETASFVS